MSEDLNQFEEQRKALIAHLQGQGFKIKLNMKIPNCGAPVDVIGEIGSRLRKKTIYIWFAADEVEAGTLSFLIKDLKGTKIFVLLNGDPQKCFPVPGVNIISDPTEIELS
ncbi:MAG: hypothetical protein ACFFCQ_07295 [Promethearchaeota archaeon]